MFKKLFKKKESKDQMAVISPPVSTAHSTSPISIGTQADFSPVIARPSLLQYNTNKENDHIDDDDDTDGSTEPGGYSTVRDAIRLSSTPKNNTPRSKIPSISPIQKSQKQSVASGGRSLQQDDSNSTLASLSPYEEDNTRMVPVDDVRTPIYAQVKKVNKGNERVKKNVSISNLPMKEKHKHHTMNDDNQDEDEGGMLDESLMELEEINQPDTSLPTHRLPPSHVNSLPLLTTKNKQRPSTSPNDLSNLPFYNLNQSLQLPSGDQAYLLTRTGPDGRTQHYTATVISPTPMSPVPPPSQLATSYSPSSKLEHPMQSMSSRPGDIPISLIHQQPNIAYHNQPHSSQHKLEKRPVTKSTQTTPRQNNQPEHAALKDSLMKMTAELSSHSLILEDDDNSDLMIEGISLDELIKELPQRLRKALSILNKSVADKQMQIQTYQMEVIKLKKKQDEIKHTNERLNETIRHQQESVLKEKQSFEKSLCEAKEEKEELRQKLAAQKSKYNQKKVEHKMEVTKLTSELYKLTCERDSIREQLSSMQQAHNKLQKFLKQQEPSGSVPLDDHKRSLREFECLLHDVMQHSSRGQHKSSQKLNVLKSENISLMAEITRINAELLSMKDEAAALMRENRDYHDRIARLEDDLKLARRRELTVVDELTKAIKSSNFDSSSLPMTPSTKRFRKSPGRY